MAEDYADFSYEEIEVSFEPYSDGNYTSNYANLSTVIKNSDDWQLALPEFSGAYVGAYEQESLLEIDYLSPAFDSATNNTSNPPDFFCWDANVMFRVSSEITFTHNQIMSGSSHFWLRVPTACRAIAETYRSNSEDTWIILQITQMNSGKIYHIFVDDPRGPLDNLATNVTIYGDRLYIELFMLILPSVPYRFEFISPLQTSIPNYYTSPRAVGAVRPAIYLTSEDLFSSGVNTNISAGVMKYDDSECNFYLDTDYLDYSGFGYDLDIDAGWSFLFIEGVGEGFYGREITVEEGSEILLYPTIEPSLSNAHVSFYLPFICDGEVSYSIEMARLNISSINSNHWELLVGNGSVNQWVLENGSMASYPIYWDSTKDCDGDGNIDYPDLKARDFIAISSLTLITPYEYLQSSLWELRITFLGDYNITFLCYDDNSLKYMGDATHSNRTYGWTFIKNADQSWLYKDSLWNYAFLTNGLFTQKSTNASGFDFYSYPHFYQYQVAFHYGSKTIYINVSGELYEVLLWNDTAQNNFADSIAQAVLGVGNGILSNGGSGSADIFGIILDALDSLAGGIVWVGTEAYHGVEWLAEQFMIGMNWLYRSLVSFYEYIVIVVEAIINFASFLIEFGIILVSLLVFVGAIILYNKFLMIIRDAMYKLFTGINKTYLAIGGGGQ